MPPEEWPLSTLSDPTHPHKAPELDQQENLMPSRSNKRNPEPTATAAMLKNAADIFSEALFLIDRSRRIILANNAAQKMTTLEETNLIGQQIESILLLDNPQTELKVTSIKLPSKQLLVLRAKIHAVPHSATFLPLNYIPYFAAFKPRPTALAIVTPQISTQAQDHTTATIYQQILGQLTMRIAHDFSNSLTSIIGNAELIEEQISALLRPPIPEPLTTLLDQGLPEIQDVVRKSREMAQFINTLQQYARQQPTSSRTLDLNTAITETITMARSLLGRKIQIEFLPSEELPQIYMDRLRIDQILLSILVNSKNAMPSGGRVTIGTEEVFLDAEFVATHPGAREGSYTRLSITDSSAGMDSGTLKRIFDIPNSDKTPDLASLGLPTVYSILKQFKGYIDVESWIGKGTRFLTRQSSNGAESHQHKTTLKAVTRPASQNTRSTPLSHFSASQLHSIFRSLQATTYSTRYRHTANLHPSARSHHGYYLPADSRPTDNEDRTRLQQFADFHHRKR